MGFDQSVIYQIFAGISRMPGDQCCGYFGCWFVLENFVVISQQNVPAAGIPSFSNFAGISPGRSLTSIVPTSIKKKYQFSDLHKK